MRKRAIILVLLVVAGALVVVLYQQNDNGQNTFDTEGRYDPSVLDDMGVLYSNRSDILAFNGGYSESDNCPWGAEHNGIDFILANNSDVVAVAPGRVEHIRLVDWGPYTWHRYIISVNIRFNATLTIEYGFEPITNSTDEQLQQLEMMNIENGSWVEKGDIIAKFLRANEWAHIHFGVYQDNAARDPTLYMSTAEYNELLEMVHDFRPTWNISYP
jgi:murein DD-endopeptidase MepM/ murein hydrolase activator NlpD